MGKVIFVILFFAIIFFIVYTLISNVLEESDKRIESEVPMLEQFKTKIVYTTNLTIDTAPMEADCRKRGGAFNQCGTVCDVSADACIQVCALTCENIES